MNIKIYVSDDHRENYFKSVKIKKNYPINPIKTAQEIIEEIK